MLQLLCGHRTLGLDGRPSVRPRARPAHAVPLALRRSALPVRAAPLRGPRPAGPARRSAPARASPASPRAHLRPRRRPARPLHARPEVPFPQRRRGPAEPSSVRLGPPAQPLSTGSVRPWRARPRALLARAARLFGLAALDSQGVVAAATRICSALARSALTASSTAAEWLCSALARSALTASSTAAEWLCSALARSALTASSTTRRVPAPPWPAQP